MPGLEGHPGTGMHAPSTGRGSRRSPPPELQGRWAPGFFPEGTGTRRSRRLGQDHGHQGRSAGRSRTRSSRHGTGVTRSGALGSGVAVELGGAGAGWGPVPVVTDDTHRRYRSSVSALSTGTDGRTDPPSHPPPVPVPSARTAPGPLFRAGAPCRPRRDPPGRK